MKVTKEERPQREALLDIQVESDEVEKYLDRAYRRVVQRANIPGFRRGKAPRHIVERLFGREHLFNEALDLLVPEVVRRAVQEQVPEAVGQPKVEVAQLDPVVLKATVPLKPEVDLGQYRDIRLKEEEVQVTDEQVEKVLKQLQYELAPWEPADRAVQLGDLVNLDVRGTTDGQEIANSQGADYVPQAGSQLPVPGFAEALVGVKRGEGKEFALTLPQEYGNAALAGKTCSFTVTVNEVKEKKLPGLDDEFAKSVGEGLDSLGALSERVRQRLLLEAQRAARRQHQEQVVEQVVAGAKVTMSDLLVEHEIDHLLGEQENALRQRRLSLEDYLQRVGKDQGQLREELRPAAQERLKRSLVLRRMAEVEGLEVTEEEVQREVDSLASESGEGEESLRRLFGSGDGKDSLKSMLLTQKITQRLADIAQGGEAAGKGDGQQEASAGDAQAAEQTA